MIIRYVGVLEWVDDEKEGRMSGMFRVFCY